MVGNTHRRGIGSKYLAFAVPDPCVLNHCQLLLNNPPPEEQGYAVPAW